MKKGDTYRIPQGYDEETGDHVVLFRRLAHEPNPPWEYWCVVFPDGSTVARYIHPDDLVARDHGPVGASL